MSPARGEVGVKNTYVGSSKHPFALRAKLDYDARTRVGGRLLGEAISHDCAGVNSTR
jgi:hypothetical protein